MLRRTIPVAAGLGMVSIGSIVVQAVLVAELLAGAMPGAHESHVVTKLAWLLIAAAVRALAAAAGELVAVVGAAEAKAAIRGRMVGSLLAPAGPARRADPAEVATLAGQGIDAVEVYVARCLPGLLIGSVAPIALAVTAFGLDWMSGLILLAMIGLFPVFGALVGRSTMDLARSRWADVEALSRRVADAFAGMAVLRALGRVADERRRIKDAADGLRDSSLAALRVAFLSALVLDTLASVSVALVAVPLGLRLLGGTIRLSTALAVLIVSPEVFVPLRRASAQFHESADGLAAAQRFLPWTAPAGAGQWERAPVDPDPAVVPVIMAGLHLSYPGRPQPVLRDTWLELPPGQTVVVTGDNGAGKSTLMSVLLGFDVPDAGRVSIGDVPLADVDLRVWRRRITYLPDRPTIVAGSVFDNVRLARGSAGDREVLRALERSGAGPLVRSLPDGAHTRIGEGGRRLSAGERQRIALARVFVRPGSLYLLDEPTVHLDPEAEEQVVAELKDEMQGRTALIVTHRLAVVGLADRVVELAGGRFAGAPGPGRRPAASILSAAARQ